jgi:hypothetical protein
MKILVACEESQAVTKEFRKLGHEAYSCDIQPCSGGHPEFHIQSDVIPILTCHFFNTNDGNIHEINKWDLIIAFPPCTHLSAAGAPSWKQKQTDGRQQQGIDFFMRIINSPCERIAVENPTGIMSSIYRKPDQIINPFQFGDPFRKRTCLWLKGLPRLNDTNFVSPQYHFTSNSTRGGLLKDGTRKKSSLPIYKPWDNSTERSKTFPGIAKAMAEQWTSYLLK